MKKILFSALVLSCLVHHAKAQQTDHTNINFNSNWTFVKDIDTTTSKSVLTAKTSQINWQNVSLPHTPRIEPVIKTSFEQWQGTCYYRKYFTIPADDKRKHVAIKFEAAMHEADVYLNGKHIYKHLGGYLPFYIDITKDAKFGAENCILVKLNNQDNPHIPPGKNIKDLDFNYYGGLYRGCWLIVKDKLHITDAVAAGHEAGGGIMVHFENVTSESARVVVKTELRNDGDSSVHTRVKLILTDKAGKQVASSTSGLLSINTGNDASSEQSLIVSNPLLWSPMHPNLYQLSVQVMQGASIADEQQTRVGIKTFKFEPGAFYLNGEKVNIAGTNRHQEYPYIGYALSDNAQYRDAWKIKDAGLNFVRCSHYPPSPAFLDACDELGILVMDAIPGWQFFGDEVFQQNSFQNIRDMIHRDRNHASIVLWEASLNESGMSKAYMDKAHQIVHQELPFADVFSSGWIDYAYDVSNPARQHAKAPDYWKKYNKKKPLLLAEYGDWEYYAQNAGFNQKEYAGLKSDERNSRQLRTDGEQRMLQQALNFQEAHNDDLYGPAVGDANWLMFDYKRGYAADIESSGIMDIYRLPKFAFYFYQSQYGPVVDDKGFGKPMVYIANYWNNTATKTVEVYSNCDEVELVLNGRTIARQQPDKNTYSTNLKHPPFTFNVTAYSAGKLQAIGYIHGKKRAENTRQTPGKPFAVKLRIDYSNKTAAPNDLLFVYAEIVDQNGTVVPDANNVITFKVHGAGLLAGDTIVKAEAGVATALLKTDVITGTIIIGATADRLRPDKLMIR
jgi:beta-galactosidase